MLGALSAGRQVLALELGESGSKRSPLDLANSDVVDKGGLPRCRDGSRGRPRSSAELVDRNIDRVQEPAARGRIGAAPPRIRKEQGVQRINAEEIRAAGAGPFGKP